MRQYQFLNEIGARALRMHLGRVLEMAESSPDKLNYEKKVNERFGDQPELDLVMPSSPSASQPLSSQSQPTLRRHRLRPCFAPLLAERLRSLVLAVVNDGFGFLACRDLGNADGVADHVSRALLAFRTGRQCLAP